MVTLQRGAFQCWQHHTASAAVRVDTATALCHERQAALLQAVFAQLRASGTHRIRGRWCIRQMSERLGRAAISQAWAAWAGAVEHHRWRDGRLALAGRSRCACDGHRSIMSQRDAHVWGLWVFGLLGGGAYQDARALVHLTDVAAPGSGGCQSGVGGVD